MNEVYKVVYESSEEEQGSLFGISIVDTPANDYQFVMLAKEEVIKIESEEKKLLTGVVLIPNQKIVRKFKDGRPYELFFDEPTIELLSQDFLKKGYQSNSTYNHEDGNWLEGTTIVESWIVTDPNNDKANALGFKDLPKGTWMVTMKLTDELWNEYIKSGKASGFSVDSFVKVEKINMSKLNNNKNEKMGVLKKIIDAMLGEEVRLSKIDIAELGSLTADAFELNNIVYQDVENEMLPLKDASFEYEGFKFTTDGNGKINSKEEIVVEETPAEEAPIEVALETEQVTEYETTDGSKVYSEWLTIGKVVTNESKEPLIDSTFEVQGLFYTTDSTGEVIKTEKNADSPLWVVELTAESDAVVEEVIAETEVIVEEVAKPLEEVNIEALKQTISDLQSKVDALTLEKEAVLMENVELSKQPRNGKLKASKDVTINRGASTLSAIQEIIAKNK